MTLKLLLFGIDGASSQIVNKLILQGKLPNLAAVAQKGVSGELTTCFPPHTAPGWASMFTGVEPGEHGIYQFWQTQNNQYDPRLITVHDFEREVIWKILERNGLKVGVLNVPMSHPPQPLEGGYMISWPLSTTLHYSEPRYLIRELADAGLHYHSDMVTMYRGQDDYLEQALQYIRGKTDAILYLQKKYPVDALFTVYTELDRISHYYWGDDGEPSQEILDTYVAIDCSLGRLMEIVSDDTLVIVVSDHGFGPCRYNLNVNHLLEEAGFANISLVEADCAEQSKAKNDFLEGSGTHWFTSTRAYYRTMNWEKTQAYMPTPGCFGINYNRKGREIHGIVNDAQAESLFHKIKTMFDNLKDPRGKKAFEVVPRSDVYKGKRLDGAPDLILKPIQWDIMPHPGVDPEIWTKPTQQAIHRMDGILYAHGMNLPVSKNKTLKIEDVTPLILAQLGLPVPEQLTGDWVFEPFTAVIREDVQTGKNETNQSLTDDEKVLLEQRLADLGYIA